MKKILLITISALLLGSVCFLYFTNKNIEGLYIKKYHFSQGDSLKVYELDQNILEIKDQKFKGYFWETGEDSLLLKYFRIGNVIKLSPNENPELTDYSTLLKKNESDSIVLVSTNDTVKIEGVFSKIPDSLKNNRKINLEGKLFVFKNEEYKLMDTVYFDKNLFLKKDTEYNAWSHNKWERLSINGFELVKIDSWATPIYIVKERGGRFYFYSLILSNKVIETKAFEIKKYNKQKKLDRFVEGLKKNYVF